MNIRQEEGEETLGCIHVSQHRKLMNDGHHSERIGGKKQTV